MKKSFTLIEMIVVIAVIGLVLPALFSIVFVILQQQTKIYRLSEVKKQGDAALSIIEDVMKNNGYGIYSEQALTNEKCAVASSVYPAAAPYDGANFYLKDKLGNWFRFDLSNSAISSSSAHLIQPASLTNSKVVISSDHFISCSRTSLYSTPLIFIKFSVSYNTTSTRNEEIASITYQTRIKLKNY